MKTSTAILLALALFSPSAFADNNTGAVSGNNNTLTQATGNGVINSGAGAGAVTAQGGAGGAGGNATARSGDSSVIASGNSFNANTTGNQTATTGSQSVNIRDRKQAPPVFAPGLTNGYNCNGSVSFGGSVAGFGFGGGTTEPSKVCEGAFLFELLKAEGDTDGAWGVLCDIPQVRKHSSRCPAETVDDLIGRDVSDFAPTNASRKR